MTKYQGFIDLGWWLGFGFTVAWAIQSIGDLCAGRG